MDKLLIKQILLDQKHTLQSYEIEPRNYTIDPHLNYVFVGVRRAGKSYMLYHVIHQLVATGRSWDEVLYMNFEDERLENFTTTDFATLIECHQELYGIEHPVIFLDEMQNISGWEKFARRMADSKAHIMLTGSNAKMLSREIMGTLGGRFVPMDIYPYSFAEMLNILHIRCDEHAMLQTNLRSDIIRQFDIYLHWGGMPETAHVTQKRQYLSSVYQKIYLNDIAARSRISNLPALRLMVKKVADSLGQPISYNRLGNIVSTINGKISVPTIQTYISAVEEAWLLLRLRNIAASVTERESVCKYYFVDNGFLNLFLFDGETALLENQVALELFRRYGHDLENDTVYFYNNGAEVDFYIPSEEWAIQVCYSLTDPQTLKREKEGLLKIAKALPCRRRTIITYDTTDVMHDEQGEIDVIPCWRWLLNTSHSRL
ncbi:MAG: ATP-binding protein [Paludibacteraceae bacterium]|nr:ATP-binding protein [Paludibacteraceae bacterium]